MLLRRSYADCNSTRPFEAGRSLVSGEAEGEGLFEDRASNWMNLVTEAVTDVLYPVLRGFPTIVLKPRQAEDARREMTGAILVGCHREPPSPGTTEHSPPD
jgi:hypothetical protein